MDITFNCDQCGQSIVIDEAGAGTVVDCPKCSESVLVPGIMVPEAEQPTPSAPQNLRSCPDCGREVSKRAAACPHCGAPLSTPKPFKRFYQATPTKTDTVSDEAPISVKGVVRIIGGLVLGYAILNLLAALGGC